MLAAFTMKNAKILAFILTLVSILFPVVLFCRWKSRKYVTSFGLGKARHKFVIYLCDGSNPCGGWADRQKGILSSFVLAEALGRNFRIRMTKPCELSNHLMPKDYDWRINETELIGLSHTNIKVIDQKAAIFRQKMMYMDIEKQFPEDIIYFTSNMEFTQFIIRNEKYKTRTEWMRFPTVRELYVFLLSKLFQFVPDLENQFQNFVSSIPRKNGTLLICAQIRLGRNPTVPDDTELFNKVKSVKTVWNFLKQFKVGNHKLFVTSDSEQVREEARKMFHSNILDTKGSIVHIERYGWFKNVCEGFSKVLLDQRILSTCDHLIISRSGFAMIGAWHRNTTDNLYCFSKGQIWACHPDKLDDLIPSW